MRIFVTGATGYIGRHIAAVLDDRGHDVLGLARSVLSAEQLSDQGYEVHRGDLSDETSLQTGVMDADATVHTAFSDDPENAATLERDAVAAMLDTVTQTGSTFVYTSDVLLYGETESGPVDEQTPLEPDAYPWRANVERAVRAADEDSGAETTALRVSMVYGNGGNDLLKAIMNRSQNREAAYYVGDGTNEWATVHVEELANLYASVIEGCKHNLYNAVSRHARMRDVMSAIGDYYGIPVKSITPEKATEKMILGGELGKHQRVSNERAHQEFDWEPTEKSLPNAVRKGDIAR